MSVTIDGRRSPVGVNATARWSSAYRVRLDSGRDGPDDLKVAAFVGLDLRASHRFERNGSDSVGSPARRGIGTELELAIVNVLDGRPDPSLGDGRSAPGYGAR